MTALLKLLLVFAGIVLLLNRKWNLGLVLLLAAVAIGVLFGYPIQEIGWDVLLSIIDPLTLRLALIVVLVMILGELLRQSDSLDGMVEALQGLIPNARIVIATLPAVVGLLPMVGGAMLSAPMVDTIGERIKADKERRMFINFWFRHIWEPVFPLYPSMLLAAELLGLTPAQLMGITWPVTAAAAAGGLLFGLVGLPRRGDGEPVQGSRGQSLWALARSIWPVVFVIVLSLVLPVDNRVNLIISLVLTIALVLLVHRIPVGNLGTILRRHIPWNTVVVIFGALAFRCILENSGAVVGVSDGLTRLHIPVAVVAFAVPFVVGMLTGLVAATYSVGFPVVLPLVAGGGGTIPAAWAAWTVAGGFVGIMCSPMHLCLALTRVYFKAEWGRLYRLLVPAALLVTVTAGVVLLLR